MLKILSHKPLIQTLILLTILGFPLKSFANPVGVHTIFELQGIVTVQKEQWKNFQPAFIGLTLTANDKLNVAANSSVKVYCSNNTTWIVKPGTHNISSGCPSGTSVIRLPNSNNDTLRTDGQTEEALAKLPYLITPRNSFILNDRPLRIRWNAVPGANTYTVNIDGIDWETKTNETEIIYLGESTLQPGWRYRVTIEADNGASSKSDAVVGFKVLDEGTKQTVLEAVETIEQQSLSSEEKAITLANLYRGYGLYADAIEVLEKLVKQGSQIFAVHQLLGDIYLETGLPQLAKKPYDHGLQLAIETENLSAQADIQAGLGRAYYNLGNETEAKQWLDKAKASYEELGDSTQVQELEETINSILQTVSSYQRSPIKNPRTHYGCDAEGTRGSETAN